MLSKQEMSDKLLSIGLKRKYKPYWDGDSEHGSICLETRKFSIVDGELSGSEIDVCDDNTIRVWTSKKPTAMARARENGFKIKLFDGEAELYIPADRADEFLHKLGAKVRMNRIFTPEQKAALAARLASGRQKRLATTQ